MSNMILGGKKIKLTVIHYGLQVECEDFYKGLSQCDIQLTGVVNASIVMGSGSVFGDREIKLTFSSDGAYNLVPLELINKRRYNFGMHWFALIKVLIASDPDIIHVFNEYHCIPVTQVILIRNFFLRRNVPIVCYNFQNMDYGNLKGGIRRWLVSFMARWNLSQIQGLTSANQQGVDAVVRHNKNLHTRKIFMPVDQNLFFKKDQATCRRALNLPLDQKIVGYIGRFVEEKGLDDLIKAVANIEGALLLLIGEGEDQARLQKIADEMGVAGRVIIKPFVAPQVLKDYYNAFNCFVLPSRTTLLWKEQYGRVLVEAMMCGCPIVGSSSGAIPEVLEGYVNQKIVQEGDVASLTNGIKTMINTKPITVDQAFLKQFTNAYFVTEHVEFYKNFFLKG